MLRGRHHCALIRRYYLVLGHHRRYSGSGHFTIIYIIAGLTACTEDLKSTSDYCEPWETGIFPHRLKLVISNRVGAWGLVPHATSHTTVQAVPHTAVPTLDAIRDMNPTGSDSLSSSSWHWIWPYARLESPLCANSLSI